MVSIFPDILKLKFLIFPQGDAKGNFRIIIESGGKELLMVCGFLILIIQQNAK